jgi:putative transposase
VRSEKRVIQQAFRFELDPNRAQRVLLAKSVGASRYVYNWGLAESKRQYPRFKKKGERDSARICEVTLEERHLRIPNVGRVRLKETCGERGFDGRVLAATIARRADRWFVSLTVEREREIVLPRAPRKSSEIVGVDLGLSNAAVTHDGRETRVIEPQQALRKNLTKLRRLDRELARKQRGSANRGKAELRRARLYYRIHCQRQEMLHQLSSELARTKRVIVLEDLHVRGMQRNKHLALSISDAGMGELRRQLAYKSGWYGATLVIADRFFPASKLCSGCGTIKNTLGLNDRPCDCDACGLSLERDENAAIDLRRLGLAELPVDAGTDRPNANPHFRRRRA